MENRKQSLLNWLWEYKYKNFSYFALVPKGKEPLGKKLPNGSWSIFKKRKPSAKEENIMFESGYENVALVTGFEIEPGKKFFVLDLDGCFLYNDGKNLLDVVKEKLQEKGLWHIFENTTWVKTAGGYHIYLIADGFSPKEVTSKVLGRTKSLEKQLDKISKVEIFYKGKWITFSVDNIPEDIHPYFKKKIEAKKWEIDFKAEDGYVVAPPSVHPIGVEYKFVHPYENKIGKIYEISEEEYKQLLLALNEIFENPISILDKVSQAPILGNISFNRMSPQIDYDKAINMIIKVLEPIYKPGHRFCIWFYLAAAIYKAGWPYEKAVELVKKVTEHFGDLEKEDLRNRFYIIDYYYNKGRAEKLLSIGKNLATIGEKGLLGYLINEMRLPDVEAKKICNELAKAIYGYYYGNEKVRWIKLDYKYNENEIKEFGWLKIELVDEDDDKVVVSLYNKDNICIFPPTKFRVDFMYNDRSINKIFSHIKKELKERFADFIEKIQKRVKRALIKLKLRNENNPGIEDDDEPLDSLFNFNLDLLKVFGVETKEEALEVAHSVVSIDISGMPKVSHSKIAEFLLDKFVFKTLKESDEILYYKEGVYKQGGDKYIKELVQKLLKGIGCENLAKRNLVEEVIEYIKRETYTSIEEFKEFDNLEFLNLKNGVLDLNTMELKPHSPDYLFLWQMPVEYNPNADCPKIKRFLHQIVEEKDVSILLKMIAYVLMPGQPYKVAFYLYGDGSNGKSTFLNVVSALLGKENVSAVNLTTLELNRFAIYQLYGKLANISAETPDQQLNELRVFKQITGYDPVYIEKKFKDGFTAYLRTKLIFAGNRLPEIKNLDDATIRRWILIRFPYKFKQNANLLSELTTPEELSGLLNLVLDYYKKIKVEGIETPDIEEYRKIWLRLSNPLLAFVHEAIELDPDSEVIKDDIWEAFYRWCKKNNIPFVYKGEGAKARFFKALNKTLQSVGININIIRKSFLNKRYFAYVGIRLKEEAIKYDDTVENPKEIIEEILDILEKFGRLGISEDLPEPAKQFINELLDLRIAKLETYGDMKAIVVPNENYYKVVDVYNRMFNYEGGESNDSPH